MFSSISWASAAALALCSLDAVSAAVIVRNTPARDAAANQSKSPAVTFAACQKVTAAPLDGCPAGTLYVSQTDASAQFTSIQAAVDSLQNTNGQAYILVGAGTYYDRVTVVRQDPLYILGQTDTPAANTPYGSLISPVQADGSVVYPETEDGYYTKNLVQVYFNLANTNNDRFPNNLNTSVLTVGPCMSAVVPGSGAIATQQLCTDFRVYNMDFRNEAVPYTAGPALALGTTFAQTGFYGVGMFSWQDTIYVGKNSSAYFYDSIIGGQTDFLYGYGTLYITHSTLLLRHYGGGITAWKGTNTTFENKYGVYIDHSNLIANNASTATQILHKTPLGRPWNSQTRSVYMNCYFDSSISPNGYVIWQPTETRITPGVTLMAVWSNYGPGWNTTSLSVSPTTTMLDDQSVLPYRWPVSVFQTATGAAGNVGWIDPSVLVGP